ncbi:histidine triad nucleotide-binding protein [Acetivibrio cellulolyticus]|uniref:histidine triad nucleotide-binding protein n=1 Tax=Acetivibrio cellulolyticus TaxID=35830 RepID=UPI0001E2D08B|nr:histidine triad nucleotide-binding protein [Acetivibrio cellulolyticus]
MENCIFCKIINREIPSTIVYEDDKVLAFKDINPVAPVHVLIIPKVHIKNVMDLNEQNLDILKDIHLAAKKIAGEMGVADKGFRLITNCGEEAGQTVFHLHYHLIGGKELGPKII